MHIFAVVVEDVYIQCHSLMHSANTMKRRLYVVNLCLCTTCNSEHYLHPAKIINFVLLH